MLGQCREITLKKKKKIFISLEIPTNENPASRPNAT